MAERNEDILEMVRRQLQRTNPPNTEALYGRAAQIDDSVRDLSLRQFHARYPLQVKREMARAEREKTGATGEESAATGGKPKAPSPAADTGGKTTTVDREAVREILLDLAREVTGAEGAHEMVDLLAGLEGYVDRVEATVG